MVEGEGHGRGEAHGRSHAHHTPPAHTHEAADSQTEYIPHFTDTPIVRKSSLTRKPVFVNPPLVVTLFTRNPLLGTLFTRNSP